MKRPDIKKNLAVLPVFCIGALILYVTGIGCPIRFLTGIPCAGCGMTRAWIGFLRGDFKEAFSFHPLFLLLIPAGILFLLQDRIPLKIQHFLMWIFIVMFVIIYFVRIFLQDPVLQIDPANSMIEKIFRRVINVL